MSEKKCNKCEIVKPLEDYWKVNTYKDGRDGTCADCRTAARRARFPNTRFRSRDKKPRECVSRKTEKPCTKCKEIKSVNIENFEGKGTGFTSTCRECLKKSYKERYEDPEYHKKLKCRKFGITTEEYDGLIESQNGLCAICKNKEVKIVKNKLIDLCIDHCHKTQAVRGFLCSGCNVGIGHLKEDFILMLNAIKYLMPFSEKMKNESFLSEFKEELRKIYDEL